MRRVETIPDLFQSSIKSVTPLVKSVKPYSVNKSKNIPSYSRIMSKKPKFTALFFVLKKCGQVGDKINHFRINRRSQKISDISDTSDISDFSGFSDISEFFRPL